MGPSASLRVFTLNNSKTIPVLGLGTYLGSSKDYSFAKAAVLKALEVGYRHIDTASAYQTENAVGDALQEAFAKGLVTREEVFITTKVAPDQLAPEDIVKAAKRSVSNLQLEYLDLLLVHWPIQTKPDSKFGSGNAEDYVLPFNTKAIWEQMEKVVELGLSKTIGVSNFYDKVMKELLAVAKIPPAVNQIELHPSWHQDKVRAFCKENNIHVSAWSPLGSPGTVFGSTSTFDSPIIKEIAKKHGKSIAQVALRWEHEIGVSSLPKSVNPTRIVDNFDIWDFSLTEEDHQKIKTMPQVSLCENFGMFQGSPWKSFAEFWDNDV